MSEICFVQYNVLAIAVAFEEFAKYCRARRESEKAVRIEGID